MSNEQIAQSAARPQGDVVGIDVGGTFTDCVALHPDGSITTAKVFTTPEDLSDGVVGGLRALAQTAGDDPGAYCRNIHRIVHGTTVTTNAVLTDSGVTVGLLTTKGFRDALQMRRGVKERQYDNRYQAPVAVIPRHRRIGIHERVAVDGTVLDSLAHDEIRHALDLLRQDAVEAIAVCFMHAYRNTENEQRVGRIVRELAPDLYVTLSSDLLPKIGFYERVSTTAFNAYVGPILHHYMSRLEQRLTELEFDSRLVVMQSNGGVMSPDTAVERAVSTLLSGPAAGPIAGAAYVASLGYADCITVDMGGTSFDATLVRDGQPLIVPSTEIDGREVALPTTDIHTIGAGGGSIGWIDAGGLLRMGPASAGADPGPACYGRGGDRATATDADLVLGYLNPDFFLGGELRLDREQAVAAIERDIAKPLGFDVTAAAAGMYRIINVNMASGVRKISVNRGIDPRETPLVVAGGAGPVHAGRIAQELGIRLIIVPRQSALFCALGMLLADLRHDYVRTHLAPLVPTHRDAVLAFIDDMTADGQAALVADRVAEKDVCIDIALDLRYVGQHREIKVPVTRDEIATTEWDPIRERFHALHDRFYGHHFTTEPIEMVNVRVLGRGITDTFRLPTLPYGGPESDHAVKGRRAVYLNEIDGYKEVSIYDGSALTYGNQLVGPAVVEEVSTTIVVPPAYELCCDIHGSYVMAHKQYAEHVYQRLEAQSHMERKRQR